MTQTEKLRKLISTRQEGIIILSGLSWETDANNRNVVARSNGLVIGVINYSTQTIFVPQTIENRRAMIHALRLSNAAESLGFFAEYLKPEDMVALAKDII